MYRLTCLIAEEALLFATLGVIHSGRIIVEPQLLLTALTTGLLCFVSIAVAVAGFFGVRAAQKEIKTLADASKTPGPPPAGYPPVISAGHHTAGHILPWVLPILTASMWFYFLAILMAKVVNHGP
jgi:hypothetical protein